MTGRRNGRPGDRRQDGGELARCRDDSSRPWTRRALLAAASGAGGQFAGCLDFDFGTSEEDRSPASPRTEESGAEATAEQFADHRRAELRVSVTDGSGDPVRDATVSVTMRRHDFNFGTSVDARHLVERTSPGDPYRERLPELFNMAVVEHRNKWKPWENESERAFAIEASEWLLERGLDLRGHAAIWQRFEDGVVPDDVVEKVESEDDDRAEYVTRRAREHVPDIVGRYAGDVAEWDVVNEQIEEHRLTDVINPDAPVTRAPELLQWFERAREADPEADLYLNEYDILAGDHPAHRDDYEEIARFLLEEGVDLDGLGMQAHHDDYGQARSPEEIRSTLDRFGELGVDLQVTEYDTHGDGWTEERAADHLRTFLRTVFDHPAVEGFVMWGFWDGAHWSGQAPLFREDWTPKPAYDVYRSLVFDEWWTDEEGRTDGDGVFRTDVFLGELEVTVSLEGASATRRVSVTDPSTTTRVDVRLDPG